MQLHNGKDFDILTEALDEISKWLQTDEMKPESGGYTTSSSRMGLRRLSSRT